MKLNTLTLYETVGKLKRKEISHAEVFKDTHDAIAEVNNHLNVYLALDTSAVAKAEKLLDTPLAGAPVAVKDNFLTVGLETTASSNVLKGFMPPYESTVTKRLVEAGGVIVGKTNMDAWAHGSSTETSDFGPTKNPRNADHLPGGSSGGSAAAVAANLCAVALGSETAGSIRQPAAWCGVVGLKPTYGRTSRHGVVAMASSTDTPGPLGKTVRDCAMIFSHISGYDKMNATTSTRPVPDLVSALKKGIKGMKIGLCYVDHPQLTGTPAADAVITAGKELEKLGAHVEPVPVANEVKPKHMLNPEYSIGVYTVVQRGEVSSNLARYDGIRFGQGRDTFGAEAKRRIMLGTFTLSHGYADKYYVRAQQVRSLIIRNFTELFGEFDLLIAPTSPGFAQKLGASKDNPMYGELEDMLLEASSIAGLPGISVPCFTDPVTGLSIGLNIMANQWEEEKVIRAAYAYEQATKWNAWVMKESE
jgi:aspartyl-tRNA(Asn)/glutamyl-tRNA(Gln) amidotransferase subunit A